MMADPRKISCSFNFRAPEARWEHVVKRNMTTTMHNISENLIIMHFKTIFLLHSSAVSVCCIFVLEAVTFT